jgi:uncharacterized membrane protein
VGTLNGVSIRTRRWANERIAVLVGLGLASVLCLALEFVREAHYHGYGMRFMVWNLVLAWVPLLLAVLIYDRYRLGRPLLRLAPWALLWLLFLPNAPYTLTDFIHLAPGRAAPLWYDGAMISAFAWTGLLLGFVSIYLVQAVVRHRFGSAVSWCGVFGVFALVSVGVYLGRFKRWNSWDLLVRPGRRLAQVAAHLSDPTALGRAMALTLVFTGLLTAAYFAFYVLVGVRLENVARPNAGRE